MRFKTQREILLKPLQLVIGVVERRQTLPVLSNLLVVAREDGISLTATDLEVELVAQADVEVDQVGEVTLPARKLLDICRTLPEQATLEIAVDGERAQLRSGRSRFSLATLPASEFPTLDEIHGNLEFTLPQRAFRQVIERTQFSMAQQDVRYYLNGLMLEVTPDRLRSVATDGHRLAVCDCPAEIAGADGQQVIVPRKGIQELARLLDDSDEAAGIAIGSNHFRLQLPQLRFTSKLIDGRFPDYERVLPKDNDKSLIANRDLLRQALVRTSILSNEKYRGIRMQLDDGRLRVQAHNPEQEEAEEEIEVQYGGGELEIGFNVNYLLDALNALDADEVEIGLRDSNSSCLVHQPGTSECRYVIMPMRL